MEELFASGQFAYVILGFMVLECLALAALRRVRGRGPRLPDYLSGVLAGAGLVLALRASIAGADWPWVGACLLLSLAAHLDDMRRRWSAATRV